MFEVLFAQYSKIVSLIKLANKEGFIGHLFTIIPTANQTWMFFFFILVFI